MSGVSPSISTGQAPDEGLAAATKALDPVSLVRRAESIRQSSPTYVLAASLTGMEKTRVRDRFWDASRAIGMAVVCDSVSLRRAEIGMVCRAIDRYAQTAGSRERETLAIALVKTLQRPNAVERLGARRYLDAAALAVTMISTRHDIADVAGTLALRAISDPATALSPAQRFIATRDLAGQSPWNKAKVAAMDQLVLQSRTDTQGQIPIDSKYEALLYAITMYPPAEQKKIDMARDVQALVLRRDNGVPTIGTVRPGAALGQVIRPRRWHATASPAG